MSALEMKGGDNPLLQYTGQLFFHVSRVSPALSVHSTRNIIVGAADTQVLRDARFSELAFEHPAHLTGVKTNRLSSTKDLLLENCGRLGRVQAGGDLMLINCAAAKSVSAGRRAYFVGSDVDTTLVSFQDMFCVPRSIGEGKKVTRITITDNPTAQNPDQISISIRSEAVVPPAPPAPPAPVAVVPLPVVAVEAASVAVPVAPTIALEVEAPEEPVAAPVSACWRNARTIAFVAMAVGVGVIAAVWS